MEVDAGLAAMLRELEEEMLTISGRRDGARLRELLAEDFREFGSSGRVWTREEIVAELALGDETAIAMTDFRAEPAGDDVVLVTYRARREGAAGVRETLRSSLWVRRDGRVADDLSSGHAGSGGGCGRGDIQSGVTRADDGRTGSEESGSGGGAGSRGVAADGACAGPAAALSHGLY